MGQETSHLIDPNMPPDTLSDRSIRAVAQLIKDGKAKNIVVMAGAGISTAAGIPDFRSPKTGLYHNLSRFNLPHPESVFEISFFCTNPEPFYLLAKELYPGNFSPTVSHAFIALLAKKGLLRMLFTQNIDCLERAAGVPPEKIVEAHGSFATQRCVECHTEFPDDLMREHVTRGEPPRCIREDCNGLVKPDIVFFGEPLPKAFWKNIFATDTTDLMLIMGTSLLVHPFASLPRRAKEGTPRVLFNLERVGDMGTRVDDVLVLEDCDSGIRKLADELGWRDELEASWRAVVGEEEANRQLSKTRREEGILDELEKLVEDVDNKLGISEGGDGKSEANVAKQGEGATAGGSSKPDTIQESGKESAAPGDAAQLVDDGETVPEKSAEEEGRKEDRKGEGKDAEALDQGNAKMSYEPMPPTKEKPVTEEDGLKTEDKGDGDKPAL
ncbi:NAD-dependent deacetylase sirtuin-2 [Daldinia caldariorum]|uniref:NAD-dependent deacetylase sirtuin-2 n=1 Tax=Daldinia caldariorum TaxID=326644 RepID=UPI00200772B8|nr:NAD-dependent deacetylase sirtuin-2 [Daldinia caldariorum]KAI1463596.1 NAD-dependent deacetylase sirtuin-2 [Daldinia caldariorum]